ncbi:MAG TPA: methylmalonyl Co-A mutase-associated GTPase MeaB, partial [Patescibacteria group bacterium]|nr:methylmalonyl Co-A mutase-associated GTPase MeaB [Patescibacteria group bacterium]
SLQFMKAGIAEIPHVVVVTKADMGAAAQRARADVKGALSLAEDSESWDIPVLMVSSMQKQGIDDLVAAIDSHRDYLLSTNRLASTRQAQAEQWLVESVRERFGREGVRRAGDLTLRAGETPFRRLAEVAKRL